MTDSPMQPKANQADCQRPLRNLLLLMPHLQLRFANEIDWEGYDPDLLVQISANADITMNTVHRGTAAIGQLLVFTSPEIGTGEFAADAAEALGFLLSELGDLAATAHCLTAACQRYTADYAPSAPRHVPITKP